MPFDETFVEHLSSAWEQNPSIHDGAVMIHRPALTDKYRVAGWSYRLFPPSTTAGTPSNRGSAFNSCFAMSGVAGVDALYLVVASGIWKFGDGRSHKINLPP